MPAKKIQSIFLSGTAKDCAVYRRKIQDELQKILSVTVPLQEEWIEAFGLIETICREKIVNQDGYIGLFGYRHGWQPRLPTSEKSITHLEWEFALEHWSDAPVPPIFIFLPEPGQEADRELKRWADEVLEQEHPHSEAERQASLKRQQDFLDQVHRAGRIINSYKTLKELTAKCISSIYHWNLNIIDMLDQPTQGSGGPRPRSLETELGAIGRDEQLEALARILFELRQNQQEVSAAFIVHGAENHGQRHFAYFLSEWEEWENDDKIFTSPPPDRHEDPNHLARWICKLLEKDVSSTKAMDILAATLAVHLRKGNVVLVLQSLGDSPDRWVQFLDGFWKPLRRRLGQAVRQNLTGRFVLFVVDHQPCPSDQEDVFNSLPSPLPEAALKLDTAKLIPLPELRRLCHEHVYDWLNTKKPKLNGKPIKYEQRDKISKDVTRTDGIPISVYERLLNKGSWNFLS